MKRLFAPAFLLALLAPLIACAQDAPATYVEGTHYVRLDQPVKTLNADKVEVVELFWYGCHHCYTFEPLVKAWKKNLPDDVEFRQIPAVWNATMSMHARAFFAARALNALDKVHDPLFNALNVEGKKLASTGEIRQLFVDHGVAEADFDKAWNMFSVDSQVKQADSNTRSYRIGGTPEMVVNGKFRVSARGAGGQAGMLEVVDYLVAQEQAKLASNN